MQISISGQQLDITESLHNHVSEKVEKIVRHFDHVTNTNVVLQVEKTRHIAEATVNTKGAMIHASSTADDMYSAIDATTFATLHRPTTTPTPNDLSKQTKKSAL